MNNRKIEGLKAEKGSEICACGAPSALVGQGRPANLLAQNFQDIHDGDDADELAPFEDRHRAEAALAKEAGGPAEGCVGRENEDGTPHDLPEGNGLARHRAEIAVGDDPDEERAVEHRKVAGPRLLQQAPCSTGWISREGWRP